MKVSNESIILDWDDSQSLNINTIETLLNKELPKGQKMIQWVITSKSNQQLSLDLMLFNNI